MNGKTEHYAWGAPRAAENGDELLFPQTLQVPYWRKKPPVVVCQLTNGHVWADEMIYQLRDELTELKASAADAHGASYEAELPSRDDDEEKLLHAMHKQGDIVEHGRCSQWAGEWVDRKHGEDRGDEDRDWAERDNDQSRDWPERDTSHHGGGSTWKNGKWKPWKAQKTGWMNRSAPLVLAVLEGRLDDAKMIADVCIGWKSMSDEISRLRDKRDAGHDINVIEAFEENR